MDELRRDDKGGRANFRKIQAFSLDDADQDLH